MGKLDPAPRSVALLYADDAFDVSVAKGTREMLGKAGPQAVLDERYSTNASDFLPAAQIKSSHPDAVLVAGHETEALNFIRQAKSLDRESRSCLRSRSACRAPISARRWARMRTTRSA